MKNLFLVLILISILILSCDSEGDSSINSEGTVTIISVTPSTDLIHDVPTDFTVEVDYSLVSSIQGELVIGFNNGTAINTYYIISDASIIIDSGSGSHIFDVTATTKDWGVEGNFRVFVGLNDYPHASTYTPLATDRQILTF